MDKTKEKIHKESKQPSKKKGKKKSKKKASHQKHRIFVGGIPINLNEGKSGKNKTNRRLEGFGALLWINISKLLPDVSKYMKIEVLA